MQAANPLAQEGIHQLKVSANAVQVTCMNQGVAGMPGAAFGQIEPAQGSLIEQGLTAQGEQQGPPPP